MKTRKWLIVTLSILIATALTLPAQQQKPNKATPLAKEDLAKLLPDRVFIDGEAPTVQKRNAAAARMEDGKLVVVMLVDTAGYGSEYQEKYTGLLQTQGTLYVNAQVLKPGAYAFGRKKSANGEAFAFYDLGGNPVAEAMAESHEALRPVMPLQLKEETGKVRFYLGKSFVNLSARAN